MGILQEQKIFDGLGKLQAVFTAAVTDIITSSVHGLKNDDIVQLTTDTTLPAGLSLSTTYYIIEVTADTFKLALTPGGVAVSITDTGTGIHTFHLKGHALLVRGFRHLVFDFIGTDTAVYTLNIQGSNSEDKPNFENAASLTNRWDYVQVIDLENATTIDGDVGIAVIANEKGRQFEVNTNGITWLCANITAWTTGKTAMIVTGYSN